MRAHFLQHIFLFLLVHDSEFLDNLIKTNKSYCTRPHLKCGLVLNGLRGYKGPGPPLIGETKTNLKNWGLISLLMCKKCLFDTQIFKNLPTVVPHHFPARSLRSLALAPCNPGYASNHIVYVCSLHFPLS